MGSVEFKIVKRIGTLCSTKNESVELCVVQWGYYKPKYDLRRWGEEGTVPYSGVTFSETELLNVYDLLKIFKKSHSSASVLHSIVSGNVSVKVHQIYGEYKHGNNMCGLVTYSSWHDKLKCDIRLWDKDFTTFKGGVSLDDNEVDVLISLIEKELNVGKKEDKSFDTSSIDDLLML